MCIYIYIQYLYRYTYTSINVCKIISAQIKIHRVTKHMMCTPGTVRCWAPAASVPFIAAWCVAIQRRPTGCEDVEGTHLLSK